MSFKIPVESEEELDQVLLGNKVVDSTYSEDASDTESEEKEEEAAPTESNEEKSVPDQEDNSKGEEEGEKPNQTDEDKESESEEETKAPDESGVNESEEGKKKYPRGAERKIGRMTKKFSKKEEAYKKQIEEMKAENLKIRQELIKSLPEEQQEAQNKILQDNEARQKDLEIETLRAQENWRAQTALLNESELSILQGAPADLLDDKPMTTLAVQKSNIGAKVLVEMAKSPQLLEVFEGLSDQGGYDMLNYMAEKLLSGEQNTVTQQNTVQETKAPEVTPPKQVAPPPEPIPTPTTSKNVNIGSGLSDKTSDEELYNKLYGG